MKALGLDCEEFGLISEKSLMWRSKPSQSQTWLRRWKRVSYIQHLSTRTLKPSHTKRFVDILLSSLPDSHVSRLVLPEDETQQKIRDIYTHILPEESLNANQIMLFSKMSKESSAVKPQKENRYSSMSSEIWKIEVIAQRGEYSQRLKQVHHISEKESLSWPTATQGDPEGGSQKDRIEMTDSGFKLRKKNKPDMTYGAKLRDAVEYHEEKNWATPTTQEIAHHDMELTETGRRASKDGTSSHSMNLEDSARRWATPNTMDYLPPKEGEAQARIFRTHRKGRKAPCNLREQVNPKSWPTPQVGEEKATKPGGTQNQKMLSHVAIGLPDQEKSSTSGKSQESWPTVTVSDQYNPMPRHDHERKILRGVVHNINHSSKEAVAVGKLNPNWVEQMMGLPVGWTQLSIEWID